jgi:hypothetical protein
MLEAARSICDISQPPKMSPAGLASAGMAMVRITGSPSESDGGGDVSFDALSRLLPHMDSHLC